MPAAILDSRKSLLIAFLAISDQSIRNFFFQNCRHFHNDSLQNRHGASSLNDRSMAASNIKLMGAYRIKLWRVQAFSSYFYKMAVIGQFCFQFLLRSIEFFHYRSSMAVSNMNVIWVLV